MKVIFAGTPEFAVASLEALVKSGFEIPLVITSPDRPAGRGCKLRESAVKQFAKTLEIPVLCPENLNDIAFLEKVKSVSADVIVVVAFRKLPEVLWSIPPLGTINLHASLLPKYRGAAPINWAIINGETTTGLTTFFINNRIDEGEIIDAIELPIEPNDNAGSLHDKLKIIGGELVVETIKSLASGKYKRIPQSNLDAQIDIGLYKAPKLHRCNTKINWDSDMKSICNFIRGLSPIPGAWTELVSPDGTSHFLKIYQANMLVQKHKYKPGTVLACKTMSLRIAVKDGFVQPDWVQLACKKPMKAEEMLKGFCIGKNWSC